MISGVKPARCGWFKDCFLDCVLFHPVSGVHFVDSTFVGPESCMHLGPVPQSVYLNRVGTKIMEKNR